LSEVTFVLVDQSAVLLLLDLLLQLAVAPLSILLFEEGSYLNQLIDLKLLLLLILNEGDVALVIGSYFLLEIRCLHAYQLALYRITND
jgi:hypothetical protein